jgi:hypothetical protein
VAAKARRQTNLGMGRHTVCGTPRSADVGIQEAAGAGQSLSLRHCKDGPKIALNSTLPSGKRVIWAPHTRAAQALKRRKK